MAQRQPKPPTPVPAEPPAGTLRATTTMRAALPLKAANARADRAEERARENALRTQIDELNAEMAVMRAEADRALDRLNKQVEARSAEVVQAEKRAVAAVGRAERAEAGRDAERAEADALRTAVEELRAGQAMMIDMHARELALAQHDALAAQQAAAELRQSEESPEGEGACGAAQGGVAGGMSDLPPGLARMPSTADVTPPLPGAWCRTCHGTRWWTERREPRGWRCARCHPPAHLPAEAIRRDGEG